MASFFFSDDSEEPGDPPKVSRPVLTTIRGGAALKVQDSALSVEPTPSGLGQRRAEVAPPTLFFRSRPAWKTWATHFWGWLWELDYATPQAAPMVGLRKVKSEFCSALWDLQSMRANQVRDMIERARSLRELWHLRADVFRVIAVHRGQIEAQERLEGLDSHFPVRSSSRSDPGRNSKVASW
jgi:hypothetical protein